MAMQLWNYKGMCFYPGTNFVEFIPEGESRRSQTDPAYQPRTLLLDEVEAGQRYEVVFTGLRGSPFVRYRIGDMIKITAKKATEYYVHTAVSMGVVVGRFYFKPLRYQSLALAESLKGGACTTDVLNKYKFKEVKDAKSASFVQFTAEDLDIAIPLEIAKKLHLLPEESKESIIVSTAGDEVWLPYFRNVVVDLHVVDLV